MLVAIAIPIFTSQLEKSRESTDIANVRSAYAEIVTNYLTTSGNDAGSMIVEAKQTVSDWQGASGTIEYFSGKQTKEYNYSAQPNGKYKVTISVNTSTGEATPVVEAGE